MASRAQIWLACLVFATLIFAFDLYLPLGVATGVFYVIVVLLTVRLRQRWDTPLAAAVCSVLMIVGTAISLNLSPGGIELAYHASINIVVSLIAVCATAYAISRLRASREELASLNRELEERVKLRAADAQQRADELTAANASLEREIAQREKAEITARDSQAVYASLVEDLPIPIIRKDAQGCFIFANRAFCSWVGKERVEIIGNTDFDFAPSALAEKYRRDDQSVIDTGELFLDVEKNEHGGKVNWVHVIKTPARDGAGKIVGTQAIFWDVTAKRQAEERVRQSESLYHSLVDTLPLCLLRKNADGEYTFLNRKWCEYFDVKEQDLLGKTDFDVFPPHLAQAYSDGDRQVLSNGEVYEDVEQIILPDGRQRHIDVIKSPVRDADNNITGVQIILRDVTEELRLEADLKKSEQRLQAILDNSSAVIYLKDANGRYLLVNREFEALFGIGNHEIVGKLDEDFFPPEVVRPWRENDLRVMQTGAILETEETAPTAEGERTYISIKFPLHDEGGKIYAVAGISTDITDRKAAAEAVLESQRRLAIALEASQIGAWQWDLKTNVITWDDRMFSIYGQSPETFIPSYETFRTCLHPDDVARIDARAARATEGHVDATSEFRIVRPDGEVRHISSRSAVIREGDGAPSRLTGVCIDMTESKVAEQKLKRYAARLESTNRELEEFAYVVSHDLQEPLRTLQFFSDSLQSDLGDKLDDQSRGDLQFIADAAQRMQQLVRDLLSLSRTGRAQLKLDRVPLEDCVNDAIAAISNRVRETGAAIDVDKLPVVQGDRTMLTQVFQNLVGNALKFVANGRTPRVAVTCQRGDATCIVCIADNGIGIKPEYAKKIFAPFQRLHASSEYEGTGIGLAICRKVVQRHGGNIWVESAPDEGSRFYFELPLAT